MNIHAIIPARYGSIRFPGKPLVNILGKPMFWHTYRRALESECFDTIHLATEDDTILHEANRYDIPTIMTSNNCDSGTDRVYQAAELLSIPPEDIVVNIQGDEPTISEATLTAMLDEMTHTPEVKVCTPAFRISPREAESPNIVKVVMNKDMRAIYFSRSPIPYNREGNRVSNYYCHVGLYAFRMETLREFVSLPISELERIEKLEQLRLVESGIPIHIVIIDEHIFGVDAPEDILRVEAALKWKYHYIGGEL